MRSSFSCVHCCLHSSKPILAVAAACSIERGLICMLSHKSGWRNGSWQNSTAHEIEYWGCVYKQNGWYVFPHEATMVSLVINHSWQMGHALIKITFLESSCLQGWIMGKGRLPPQTQNTCALAERNFVWVAPTHSTKCRALVLSSSTSHTPCKSIDIWPL